MPRFVLLGVVAVCTVFSVIVSPFAGRIVDKPWGAKAILAIDGTMAGMVTILCGFVTAVWQIYLLMVCVTVAAAGVDLLGAALVPLGTILVHNLGW